LNKFKSLVLASLSLGMRVFRELRSNVKLALNIGAISSQTVHDNGLRCFVINLDHREDRWAEVSAELKRVDIANYERMSALKFSPGYIGCSLSHIIALGRAFEQKLHAVMICEDDVVFVADVIYIKSCIDEFFESDAEILCLGNNSQFDYPSGEFLRRTLQTQTTSCYIVKRSAYGILLKNYSESLGMAFNEVDYSLAAIDQHWKTVQLNHKFMMPDRRVVIQSESYSDIEGEVVNYQT
jgi:hypothetical protein